MNLNAIATVAMGTAFDVVGGAGGALTTVTLLLSSRVVVDVGNDNPSAESDAPIYEDIPALKYQTREQRLAEDAMKTTAFLLQVKDLVALGFNADDEISDGDAVIEGTTKWIVYRADPDPVRVSWVLQARR